MYTLQTTTLFLFGFLIDSCKGAECGGVLTDPLGVITSPNLRSNYSNEVHCTWVINAPEGYQINVNFTDFALEVQSVHSTCLNDYLELFHGPNDSYPSVGKFCGTTPPMGFKSRSNSVSIVFSSGSGVSERGFNLTYTFSVQGIMYMGCYQDSDNQVLTDYDYFSDSNSPTECSKNCSHYKFSGVKAQTHCRCGNSLNYATQARESECYASCPGDRSQICGARWRINLYRHWGCPLGSYSVNCSKQCHCRVSSCDDVTGACGNGGCKDGWKGIACNESCPIGSYSVNCSKQCHCHEGPCDGVTGTCVNGGCKDGWKGIACNESMIYMGCYQDSGGNRVLADYDYFSDSNSPTECSNNCSNYKFFGVEAWNHCLCGNTINSATQAIESECKLFCPGKVFKICGADWRISLYRHWGCPLGSYSVNCSKQCNCRVSSCDDVTGACGNGGCKDGWKGKACNESCPLGSYSVNCSMECHCREGPCDGVTGTCVNGSCKDGWIGIACNEKCGGALTDQFGVITSPNFPSNYNSKVHCTWVINAPEGYWINVKFIEFALQSHSNCDYDYLELFNGPDASYPSIGKFCGTMPLMRFTSQSNSARIVFSANSGVSARGFRLTYTFTVHDIIYMGCYQDSGNRILADYDHLSDSNSPTECSKHCSHYKYFGVEWWRHCLCGNRLNSATQAHEKECHGICPGDRSQICGAHWRINVYRHWDCPLGSYSANCSKHCHCLEDPCDVVSGACENGGCKDGWRGIACNETDDPKTIMWTLIPIFLTILIGSAIALTILGLRQVRRRRALNADQMNQLQSSNSPQERRALNAVQLNQLQPSNNPQGEGKSSQNAIQSNQLQSSNSPQVDTVRKYDMQVETHNAEAKEEKNNDNKVINSSDFVI
ncbi:multiple epidermal growth factor-like domains protein 10 isoform X3 [Dreissena polymorpha]|uniref:multiple epidermal growth factor-like domains protein 10 isoform X3 n=1 Tax=Dreissena polymorpha TaxID=45954 RepID=UPI002265622B|nr:multiple epidermal growth factor-like domains protein 10 isoform X3 [Dreissena polymorpha]